jgi:signal transduction histidine kinase
MWSQISPAEAFAQACGVLQTVLGALLWRHRMLRRGWGLEWLALSMAAAGIVNLAAPWLVTPLLVDGSAFKVSPWLTGLVMLVGFSSLASIVAGLRAYGQRPGWRPVTVFWVLWLGVPIVVVGASLAGAYRAADWAALVFFCYGAYICRGAAQREPDVGHTLLAGVLVLYPVLVLAMGLTSLDVTTVRYLAAAPYTVIGVVMLSVTLNRLRVERERAQEELRQLNSGLEQRVVERTCEIEERNAELARSLETLGRTRNELQTALDELHTAQDCLVQSEKLAALGGLVAGVAHELNTPLGNALTTASALHDNATVIAQAHAQGSLRRAQLQGFLDASLEGGDLLLRNIGRAAKLVESFKQVAVDQGSLRRRQFHLHAVVEDTLAALRPSFKHQPVLLVQEVAPNFLLDSYPEPLEQVLTNLVQNAVLHGLGQRGALRIRIGAQAMARDGGPGVELVCEDDGDGMTEQVAHNAFDPYFTTRFGQGGSGLGLYIVYNLVQSALGGTITLTSAPGGGARFVIWLPLSAPATQDEIPA